MMPAGLPVISERGSFHLAFPLLPASPHLRHWPVIFAQTADVARARQEGSRSIGKQPMLSNHTDPLPRSELARDRGGRLGQLRKSQVPSFACPAEG